MPTPLYSQTYSESVADYRHRADGLAFSQEQERERGDRHREVSQAECIEALILADRWEPGSRLPERFALYRITGKIGPHETVSLQVNDLWTGDKAFFPLVGGWLQVEAWMKEQIQMKGAA